MKQTFSIPDGCKTVSVEQVGNQIITSFEPEKYVPKVGDLVKNISEINSSEFSIYVFKEFDECGDAVNFGDYIHQNGVQSDEGEISFDSEFSIFQKLTPEEFQDEFEKWGYVYNFETHTARKKRKRVKKSGVYFFSTENFKVSSYLEDFDNVDNMNYENGNYFATESECQKYCDYMKECSLKYFNK